MASDWTSPLPAFWLSRTGLRSENLHFYNNNSQVMLTRLVWEPNFETHSCIILSNSRIDFCLRWVFQIMFKKFHRISNMLGIFYCYSCSSEIDVEFYQMLISYLLRWLIFPLLIYLCDITINTFPTGKLFFHCWCYL